MSDGIGRQFEVHLPEESVNFYRQVAEHAKLQHSVESAMEQAPTDLSDHAALKAHLVSAHLMNPDHFWRDDSNADHPHMDPIDWDHADRTGQMPAMSHRDLLAHHDDDHAAYPEDKWTTMESDHFHH